MLGKDQAMAIVTFQFHDTFHHWELQPVIFKNINLLVGISGVGKTRILNALQRVRRAGLSGTREVNGCAWMIELTAAEQHYVWTAETSLVPQDVLLPQDEAHDKDSQTPRSTPRFVRERIERRDGCVLVDRTDDTFLFESRPLPKLKNTESAITLLRDEASMAPLYLALRRFLFSEVEGPSVMIVLDSHQMKRVRQQCHTLEALREATDIPIVVRAFILQEDYPETFRAIVGQFMDIFETVLDVRLGKLGELAPEILAHAPPFATESLALAIRERGVQGWITAHDLSAGMLRILMHVLELALASVGTVIVIDEFENSLGVNCLPALADLLLDRADELQFVLTSHHPYVINNIPSTWWKVVTRHGSVVTVTDADTIPALQTASSHEKFLQLMNLPAYEEGIA